MQSCWLIYCESLKNNFINFSISFHWDDGLAISSRCVNHCSYAGSKSLVDAFKEQGISFTVVTNVDTFTECKFR